jgi:hypothetical protein
MAEAFCEECAVKDCPTRLLNYDDDGQDAIDAITECEAYQKACDVLKSAKEYRRV